MVKPTIQVRLRWHRRFDGMPARLARQLRVDPSYACRVANGQRDSEKITKALETEMKRLEKGKLNKQEQVCKKKSPPSSLRRVSRLSLLAMR